MIVAAVFAGAAMIGYAINKHHAPLARLSDTQFARKLQSLQEQNQNVNIARATVDPHKRALGERLFFDKRLSADGRVACASCHQPALAFTDGKQFAQGVATTTAHAPTLLFSEAQSWFFWDGRTDSLAAQALEPLENPLEHGTSRLALWRLIATHYTNEYSRAFGNDDALENPKYYPSGDALPAPSTVALPKQTAGYALASWSDTLGLMRLLAGSQKSPASIVSDLVMGRNQHPQSWYATWSSLSNAQQAQINRVFVDAGHALAAFQLSLQPPSTPFDELLSLTVPDADVWEGGKLFFGDAQCHLCHSGYNFSDGQFHNTGLPGPTTLADLGRARGLSLALAGEFPCLNQSEGASGESCRERPYLNLDGYASMGAFKTPTLRHISKTAPYMHDGRIKTLEDVVRFYSDLPGKAGIGHREESLKPLSLNDEEQRQLLAFLRSL